MSQPIVLSIDLNEDGELLASVLSKQTNNITIHGLSFNPTISMFSVSGGFAVYSDFAIISRDAHKIVGTFSAQGLVTSGQTFKLHVMVYNGVFDFVTTVTVE